MDPPVPRFRLAVHDQLVLRRQLIAHVHSYGADRCVVSHSGSDVITEVGKLVVELAAPDVPAIEKRDTAEAAFDGKAQLGREVELAEAADGQAPAARGPNLESPPSAKIRRAAEEVALEERNVRVRVATTEQRADVRARGEHRVRGHRYIVPALERPFVVPEVGRQPAACL